MNKKKKWISIAIIFACLTAQFSAIGYAAGNAAFNVTLPNWQRKVVLGTGENQNTANQYSVIKVTGGTVNTVYARTELANTSDDVSNWVAAPNDGNEYKIYYTNKLGAGTSLTIKGYQKNVLSKTAKGEIWF